MLRQISIYAENKKGTLADITRILLEKNINILGSMTDDGAEYGCNRMVVSDADTACEALTQAGYLTRVRNVIGVCIFHLTARRVFRSWFSARTTSGKSRQP